MVVPNKEIVNLNILSSSLAVSNPLESNTISKDVQMSGPRSRTTVPSTNSSRESSVLSKAFSIEYLTHIET